MNNSSLLSLCPILPAEELLLADGGDGITGKFLFRAKNPTLTSDYILSVIYKVRACDLKKIFMIQFFSRKLIYILNQLAAHNKCFAK